MATVPRSREELQETLRSIRDRLDDLGARVDALGRRTDALRERLDALDGRSPVNAADDGEGRIAVLEQRLDELEAEVEALRAVDSEQSSKEEKIASIVSYAENQSSPSESEVTVLVKEIKGCTGVSRRYAYDLADDLVDEYPWASAPPAAKLDEESRQKGVRIDLDLVHIDGDGVNKFTTGSTSEGGDG